MMIFPVKEPNDQVLLLRFPVQAVLSVSCLVELCSLPAAADVVVVVAVADIVSVVLLLVDGNFELGHSHPLPPHHYNTLMMADAVVVAELSALRESAEALPATNLDPYQFFSTRREFGNSLMPAVRKREHPMQALPIVKFETGSWKIE